MLVHSLILTEFKADTILVGAGFSREECEKLAKDFLLWAGAEAGFGAVSVSGVREPEFFLE